MFQDAYVVVELQGPVMAVQIISMQVPMSPLRPCSLRLQDSLDFGMDPLKNQDSMLESIDSETPFFEFSDIHGKYIQLLDDRRMAQRTQSYNQAIICIAKPLCKGHSISVSYLKIGFVFFFIWKFHKYFIDSRLKLRKSIQNGKEQSFLVL